MKQKFLNYLHVKIIVTIRKIISRQLTLLKNGGKTLKFRRFKNKKKIQKAKILRKLHRPGSGPARARKQELWNQSARLRSETSRRK